MRHIREEVYLLQESASSLGEVVKPMGKKKVLVKVLILDYFYVIYRLVQINI